jgi:hypothetical protein
MRRISLLLIVVLLGITPVAAEEIISAVDEAQPNEKQTLQAQQLQMIMRLNKAEDLRNAEIHKRHEAYIKNIPSLSEPVIAPASSEVAPKEENSKPKIDNECGLWCKLFNGDNPVTPVPKTNDSGTVELDDF